MSTPNPGDIIVSSNEYGTIFVNEANAHGLLGALLADSATFRRQRGFHNKATGEWSSAPDFTARKIAQNGAGRVAGYMTLTGSDITGRRVWLIDGRDVRDLGVA